MHAKSFFIGGLLSLASFGLSAPVAINGDLSIRAADASPVSQPSSSSNNVDGLIAPEAGRMLRRTEDLDISREVALLLKRSESVFEGPGVLIRAENVGQEPGDLSSNGNGNGDGVGKEPSQLLRIREDAGEERGETLEGDATHDVARSEPVVAPTEPKAVGPQSDILIERNPPSDGANSQGVALEPGPMLRRVTLERSPVSEAEAVALEPGPMLKRATIERSGPSEGGPASDSIALEPGRML